MRSVVPLICAGACRASNIVRSELPATPAPAAARNFLRLSVDRVDGTRFGSVIETSFSGAADYRGLTAGSPRKELGSLCCLVASCQVVVRSRCYPRRHEPPAAGAVRGSRGDRRVHRRARLAPGPAACAGRRIERPAALPGSLRDLSRRGWTGLVARRALPGPARPAE